MILSIRNFNYLNKICALQRIKTAHPLPKTNLYISKRNYSQKYKNSTSLIALNPYLSDQYKKKKGNRIYKRVLSLFLMSLMPITCLLLGYWQSKRLDWKIKLNDLIERRANEETIDSLHNKLLLNQNEKDEEYINSLLYRTIRLEGTFDHSNEVLVGMRSFDGQPGYLVVTPFEVENIKTTILVMRGWIHKKMVNSNSRKSGKYSQKLEIFGQVREGEKTGKLSIKNDPSLNKWISINLDDLASVNKNKLVKMLVHQLNGKTQIKKDEKNNTIYHYESYIKEGIPVQKKKLLKLRNDHREYKLTW